MKTAPALLVLPGIAALAALGAACSPEAKSGIPITGVLYSAAGLSAPLTLDEDDVGTGFTMSAELDGEMVTGSGGWNCYAPLPDQYPNFDLDAINGATGFFLSIDPAPAVWTTGAHAIGDQVHLLVAASNPDRYGVAQTGTIYITKAADLSRIGQPGNDCGFTVTGPIDLVGERDR